MTYPVRIYTLEACGLKKCLPAVNVHIIYFEQRTVICTVAKLHDELENLPDPKQSRLENDASAKPPNITSASCDLDL